ncbi:MAG TPA: hypothetical protein VK478_12585 [Gemmatimonadaceae bacterium]|jgi:hypothetical protein|nr:hypothetical protein [Gemmatimonadaceae bacterium]
MKRLAYIRRRLAEIFAAGVAASIMGCASNPPSTQVTASDFDLNPLVGEWRGNYSSAETGRTGTIAFTLRAGESSASGNIVMIPRPDSMLTTAEEQLVTNIAAPGRSVLKIHFLRKEGGNLSGTLDPYTDPDCGCPATTTFQGTFKDARTIEGTFNTVPSQPGGKVTGGKWKVTRLKRL